MKVAVKKVDRLRLRFVSSHNIPLYRIPIRRWKIAQKGYNWYYSYLDSQLNFLKEVVA